MFKLPGNALVALAVLLAATVGAWLYSHYRDSWRVRIDPPNESWLHEPPWDVAVQYGELAPYIEDSIFFVTSEAGVLSLRMTLGPFTGKGRAVFERGFEEGVRAHAGASLERCDTVTVGRDRWSCFEWRQTADGLRSRHRAYLVGRGVSRVVVIFSAVEGRFEILGSPARWLRDDVAWDGPSALYACF